VSDTGPNRWAHLEPPPAPAAEPAAVPEAGPVHVLAEEYARRGADFPQPQVGLVLSGTLAERDSPFENYVVPAEIMVQWLEEPPDGIVVGPHDPLQGRKGTSRHRQTGEPPFRVSMEVQGHTFRWMLNRVGQFYFTFVTSNTTDWVGILKRGSPEQLQQRIATVEAVAQELGELRDSPLWRDRWEPEWSEGTALLLDALRDEHGLAIRARAMLWMERWVFNPGQQPGPTEDRPSRWVDHITRQLHDALRPAFDSGWPELAADPSPDPLRHHISWIMRAAGFNDTEADPKPGGSIDQALQAG
jgi:hypothetical protein